MPSLQDIIDCIQAIAPAYAIDEAAVFGSFARGEAHDDSDVDVVIKTSNGFSLFDAARFRQQLHEALSCDVDVVSGNAAEGSFAESIAQDQVMAYVRA